MRTSLRGYPKPVDIYKNFYVFTWLTAKGYSYKKDLGLQVHHIFKDGYWKPNFCNEDFKTNLKNYYGYCWFNEYGIPSNYSQAFLNLDDCIDQAIKWWLANKNTDDTFQLALI